MANMPGISYGIGLCSFLHAILWIPLLPFPHGQFGVTAAYASSVNATSINTVSAGPLPPIESAVSLYSTSRKTLLYHNVSGLAIENVEICKSRPFALTQDNYVMSEADEWLREYALENRDRKYMKKHGLIATIAYDFLGDTNFNCAIGVPHLCNVQCLTVVAHVEDLRLARQVYFVLSSASHFASALTIVHDSLVAAQSTMGLLAGKMATTFFFTQPSADEVTRANAFQTVMETTLWGAQTALNSLVPMLPWEKLKMFVVKKISEAIMVPMPNMTPDGSGKPQIDTSAYYRDDGEMYNRINAQRIFNVFADDSLKGFFQQHDIELADVRYYVDDTRQVTNHHVAQIIRHLMETGKREGRKNRYIASEQFADADFPTYEDFYPGDKFDKVKKKERDELKEYKKWEREKKNEFFDLIMATGPFEIGVPEQYRDTVHYDVNGESFQKLWDQLKKHDFGRHSQILGPGEEISDGVGNHGFRQPGAATGLGVAVPNSAGLPGDDGWGSMAWRAWGDFKRLCSGSWYNIRKTLHWLRYQTPTSYMFDNHEVDEIMMDRQPKELDHGFVVELDDDENPVEPIPEEGEQNPGAGQLMEKPKVPIRKLSFDAYMREREARKGFEDRPAEDRPAGDRVISLGPVDKSPWVREGGKAFSDHKMDIAALLHPVLDGDFTDEKSRKLTWKEKVVKAKDTLHGFYPTWRSNVIANAVTSMFSSWQANDPSKEHNEMNLHYVIQESSGLARKALKETANRIFGPPNVGDDGSTEIADLLSVGSLLPVGEGAMSIWTGSEVERIITKTVIHKTLNAALNSQKVYISCTQDLRHYETKDSKGVPVKDCEMDNSGPQNLKACIQGVVCYIYRWNDRPLVVGHHNEEPFGFDQLGNQPWEIDPGDIIRSSFFSKIYGIHKSELGSDMEWLGSGPTADTAASASHPGVFTVPVCLSPHNWNTQTKDYWIGNDLNPYALVKSLPCFCGDLGMETSQVWKDTGLMDSSALGTYVRVNCPNQFKTRLSDWLERYVALCRLNIHRAVRGGKIKQGRHRFCDMVLPELENRQIQTTLQLDPEVRYAMKCKIKRKMSENCKKYYRTPISSVWEETEPVIRARQEKEAQEMGNVEPEVIDGFVEAELRGWEARLGEIEGMEHEFKEMDRVQSEHFIDEPNTVTEAPSHGRTLKEYYEEDEDEDKGDYGQEPGVWEDGYFTYDDENFLV